MTTIAIDDVKCQKDGICSRVCPSRIFRWRVGEVPLVERADECVLCGQCLAVCPRDAIAHASLPPSKLNRIVNQQPLEADPLRSFLQQRRSVRLYKKKAVTPELLSRIAECAGYAPVGAFGQGGWIRTVTIVGDTESMMKVTQFTVDYMRKLQSLLTGITVRTVAKFSEEARSGLATLPDLKMRLAEWDQGRDAITYNAPAAVFVSAGYDSSTPSQDCSAALMTMMLMAHGLGLGTCWNGWLGNAALSSHVRGPRSLGDFLGLPKHHRVVEAFTLGWPVINLHSIPERRTDVRWIEAQPSR